MAGITNAYQNSLIDFVFRAQTWTIAAGFGVALYSAAPGVAGGGTKLTYTGYADLSITRALANFAGTQSAGSTVASSGTTGTTSNNAVLTFGAPTAGGPQTAVATALLDGAVVAFFGNLTTSRTLNNGDAAPSFAAAAFSLSIT